MTLSNQDKYGKQETQDQKTARLLKALIEIIKSRKVTFNTVEQRNINEAIDLADTLKERLT